MSDNKPNKLDEVNATLDRFAKLIEENAEQSRKDKAEYDRQQAKDKAEAKQRQQEWDRQMANLRDQIGGQANSIGELSEAMTVSDNIINLINKFEWLTVTHFDFNIRKKYQTIEASGRHVLRNYQIDGLVYGPSVAVAIEAKTTLNKKYVEKFVDKLAKFRLAYPDYQHKDLYGAVTFVRTDNKAFALAEQYGLFVIKASPPNVELANSQGFKPTKIT